VAQKSKIEWTDATWNPIRGCSMAKGSELGGCLNCYAARLNARNLPNLKSPSTGEPFARIMDSGPRWTGRIEVIPSTLELPLKWKTPQRIFVNSQSDLFHEELAFTDIDRILALMAAAPQHTYKVLTKRPEVAVRYYVERSDDPSVQAVIKRMWLGVSAEDQDTADMRIPLLLRLPVAVRFLSYEPALGPVRIDRFRGLDWVIAGGESGPSARAAHPDWFRAMRDQCAVAGIPFFFKQHGEWIEDEAAGTPVAFDGGQTVRLKRVGKSRAGATLDGVEHLNRP
jgi:protein gp37